MIVGSFQCKWVTFEVDLSLSKVCGFYFAKLLTTTNTCGVKFAVLCSQPFRLWTSVDLCGGGNPIHICSGIALVLSDTSLHRYWAKLWKYGIWNWCLYNQRRLSKRNNAHSMFEKPFVVYCNISLIESFVFCYYIPLACCDINTFLHVLQTFGDIVV